MPSIRTVTVSPSQIGDRPRRGTGENNITWQQGHHVRDVGDQGRHVEDHVFGTAELANLCSFTSQRISTSVGSKPVTIHGPSGQNESNPLARVH